MRKKCVLTYVVDEGNEIDVLNPVSRGFFDVPDASRQVRAQSDMLRETVDTLFKKNRTLCERIQALELQLQQSETLCKELSDELATVNRIRVNFEDKVHKIADIVSPF